MSATPPAPRFGVGFRSEHFDAIATAPRAVDWFEVVSDTLIGVGGARRAKLDALRAEHPILLHGVGLSIAGSEPLSASYLRGLRELADSIEPVFVSDHLCWTGFGGQNSHDLLPIAYTPEVLDHVASRVARVQDVLGRRLLLENATAYVAFAGAQLDAGEFFAALSARTGCGVLLDVNNLYVDARNLGRDPAPMLAAIPPDAVGYLHLAGHAAMADVCIDTHGAAVSDPVWDLYEVVAGRFPKAGVIVERDDDLPAFAALVAEVEQARARHGRRAGAPGAIPSPERLAPVAPAPAPSWPALQRAFFARIVDKPPGFDHARDPQLTTLLDDARPVPAARGMRVYSDAYTTGLRRALGVNFPALARVLSARDFAALATAYLQQHPPREPDFVALGAAFARFIRSFAFADGYGVSPAVLAEIAALEQAQIEVANEVESAPALGPEALGAIAPGQWGMVRFRFIAALRVVPTTHDVLPVLEAVARDENPERPAPWRGGLLVHRGKGVLATERIEVEAATLLASLTAGNDFASACDSAHAEDDGDGVARGVRTLFAACARGLVSQVELAEI